MVYLTCSSVFLCQAKLTGRLFFGGGDLTTDPPTRLHTCFGWLGHGSFVTKTAVNEFVSLLSEQSLPSDSVALADNFFTTSLNRKAHVIVAPAIVGLPLSDRGFSDGTAGLERNRVYIVGLHALWPRLMSPAPGVF